MRRETRRTSAAEVCAEEADRERPCLTRGSEVRSVLAILLAEEAMARTRKAVDLEALAHRAHGGIRRRNGGADARIVSSVQAQHWHANVRQRHRALPDS